MPQEKHLKNVIQILQLLEIFLNTNICSAALAKSTFRLLSILSGGGRNNFRLKYEA